MTTVARTLFDLAETVEQPQLKSAWDEASRLRLLRLRQIATIRERHPSRPAHFRIEPLLTAQQLYDDEVDALWPGAKLIVELDSWEFHQHRAAFEGDRDRDVDHLLAGYRTVRVTHRRLSEEPERLAAQIRTLLGAL